MGKLWVRLIKITIAGMSYFVWGAVAAYFFTVLFLLMNYSVFDSILTTFVVVFCASFVLMLIPLPNSWITFCLLLLAALWATYYGPNDKAMADALGLDPNGAALIEDLVISGDRMSVNMIMKFEPGLACMAAESQFRQALKVQMHVDSRTIGVSLLATIEASPLHTTCEYRASNGSDSNRFYYDLDSSESTSGLGKVQGIIGP